MEREIGSIFELNSKWITEAERDFVSDVSETENDRLVQKADIIKNCLNNGYKDYCLLASGREAFMMALKQIEAKTENVSAKSTEQTGSSQKKRLKCLLPMYTCDTVVMPFEYYNYELEFYPVLENFTPNMAAFEKYIKESKPDVVAVHSYYGTDTLSGIRHILRDYQAQGGIVIEDLTQCLFADLDYQADYYVVSLRKWFAIPDGGLIIAKDYLEGKPQCHRNDFVESKIKALTSKYIYLSEVNDSNYDEMQLLKQQFLGENSKAETMLDKDLTPCAMSKLSEYIIMNTNWDNIKNRRAKNAKYLSDRFAELIVDEYIKVPLSYDGTDAPLYFPIYINNREKFQTYMREKSIYIPVLWPVYENLREVTAETQYIYDNMLALPCDQRYTIEDMERCVQVICEYILHASERRGI